MPQLLANGLSIGLNDLAIEKSLIQCLSGAIVLP